MGTAVGDTSISCLSDESGIIQRALKDLFITIEEDVSDNVI